MSPAAAKERLEKLTRDEVPVTRFTLLELGEGLERATAWLLPTGSKKQVAVWRGEEGALISLDLRAHPDASIRRDGVLEVGGRRGLEFFPGMKLASVRGGTRLFATSKVEPPPPDALFVHGGETLHAWLESFDWKPEWGFNGNFKGSDLMEFYEDRRQRTHPLFHDLAWAQLGGWPLSWADETYDEQKDAKLVLRTYRESEPWVEVLLSPDGDFELRERIT